MPIIPEELVDFEVHIDGNLQSIYIALPIKYIELLTRSIWS
jgi:hypothetical protein